MTRSAKDPLLRLVESYFDDHLRRVRGASRHTLRAYAQALRLFFIFLGDRSRRPIADLGVDDVKADTVLAFLEHVETVRHNTRCCATADSQRSVASPPISSATTSPEPRSTSASSPFRRRRPAIGP